MFFSETFMQTDEFVWIVLPIMIFFMRIIDVSIGTIRIIYVSRGNKFVAPVLGFFEVLVWVIAITNIMQHLSNWLAYIAWAAGFASGNFIGMLIEEKLAVGVSLIRVITKKELGGLSQALSDEGFGTTSIDAHGSEDDVNMIYIIVKRKENQKAINLIKQFNPNAFYTIEDIRYVSHHNSPENRNIAHRRFYLFNGWRKGK